jgi:hypothetical protein
MKLFPDWQPIATAPKNGTSFIGYDPTHEEAQIYILKYLPECKSFYFSCSYPEGYIEASGEGYFRWNPTHWMPLPSAPTVDLPEVM